MCEPAGVVFGHDRSGVLVQADRNERLIQRDVVDHNPRRLATWLCLMMACGGAVA